MIAYVTSVGEPTTELCCWSLERNGFDVKLIEDNSSLWQKLKYIYHDAEDDFVRVDADVIANQTEIDFDGVPGVWWYQYSVFDWYKQQVGQGGFQFIKREALPYLREHIEEAKDEERPETYMYRLASFHNPRRCVTLPQVVGVHGYGIRDYQYVKETKARRNQTGYDFEMVERLYQL